MKRSIIGVCCIFILCSHDLFLKTHSYFLESERASELFLFNGTFDKNENTITRDRITKAKILGPDYDFTPGISSWYDKDGVTYLRFTTGAPGTYAGGVSTLPRMIALSAKEFNEYLEHDGVVDVLSHRNKAGELDKPARESYAKHVKILFQVGEIQSNQYQAVFEYPLEFLALDNPYKKMAGDNITFQLLKDGKPLAQQSVYLGHRASGSSSPHQHVHDEKSFRTDKDGKIIIKADHSGYWYLKTIHMVKGDGIQFDYVSNWATISFEIR